MHRHESTREVSGRIERVGIDRPAATRFADVRHEQNETERRGRQSRKELFA